MSIRGAAKHIPSLARGNKIFPEHVASLLGLPHVGNIFYVDANNGDDSANSGESILRNFITSRSIAIPSISIWAASRMVAPGVS